MDGGDANINRNTNRTGNDRYSPGKDVGCVSCADVWASVCTDADIVTDSTSNGVKALRTGFFAAIISPCLSATLYIPYVPV